MGNFRETLWFKKGELDIQAAQDPDGLGAADLLPVEDRYADDGTLAPADTAAFGVQTALTAGPSAPSTIVTTDPARILDTRIPIGVPTATPVGPNSTITVQVTGVGGVPANATGVVVTLTAVDATLKPVAAYLGTDLGVQPLLRIPGVVRSLVTGGAWWGFLLMTPWNVAGARIAWWISCACLLVAVAGLPRLLRRDRRLLGLAVAALLVFLAQVAFLVLLRPITPMWMVPSCLPPLALAIALGWYGWLADARAAVRRTAALLLCVQAGLALAPFSLLLRDIHALRVMPGVNPLYDVIERSDRRVEVAVPFYPVRRIDRLAAFLCRPLVLHARLAAVIEPTLGSPIRNACGHWPELRYGGVDGVGAHVAGLLAPAATASGIAPSRVVSRMAIYDRVRPIAPVAGGRWMPPRRLQIDPGSAAGPPRASEFDFDAAGADVVVLTNRLPNAAPMTIGRVTAGGSPARLLYDDGGSTLYRCAACAADASVHWQVDVRGIAGNLDLIVLPHAQDVSGAEPDR